jgi:hypothetical protein
MATFQDGINAAADTATLCLSPAHGETGIAALEQFRREWDDEKKAFRQRTYMIGLLTQRRV